MSNKEGRVYRLPTDREWSIAVGIAADEKIRKDTTPETLSGKIQNVFPWGTKWPPPDGAGNYADAFLKAKLPTQSAIPDYTDGHPTTAAVMSFKPNKLGIFDLGGNVSEWCEDWANEKMIYRVMRGASWSQFERAILFSSHRSYGAPDYRQMTETGFRCVIDTRSRAGASTIAPMPSPTTLPPAVPPKTPATAIKSDFTNSLGMKFVPVPGTKVLFCIHPTRVKDYAMYATETPDVNDRWKNNERDGVPISQGDEYPVVAVNWDDANAFCSWLSNKEGRTYRLPTDREWSFAVDIASNEMVRKDTTPESLHAKLRNVFAWGTKWPPPDGAGNYADTSFGKAFPTQRFIANYTDGFPTTSPVMSFKPNKYGLYDMGGNIRQWCEDKWNTTQPDRVLRGSNWQADDQGQTLSSHRDHPTPDQRTPERGFRVVVVSDR